MAGLGNLPADRPVNIFIRYAKDFTINNYNYAEEDSGQRPVRDAPVAPAVAMDAAAVMEIDEPEPAPEPAAHWQMAEPPRAATLAGRRVSQGKKKRKQLPR